MGECIHGFESEQCATCQSTARRASASNSGTMAGHSFALIYAPDLVPGTFVHLNIQGDSWKIRTYPTVEGPYVVVEQAGPRSKRGALDRLEDLRIEIREPYPHTSTGEGESIEDCRYWHNEIVKLNAKHGLANR